MADIDKLKSEIPEKKQTNKSKWILVVLLTDADSPFVSYFNEKLGARYFLERARSLGFWAQLVPVSKEDWGYIPYGD